MRERFGQGVLETHFALGQVDELHFGPGKLAVGWHEVEATRRRDDAHVIDLLLSKQHLIYSVSECSLIYARAHSCIALRVKVDQEDAPLHGGQTRRQIDAGRGLAYAALLVGNRDDLGHVALPSMITR